MFIYFKGGILSDIKNLTHEQIETLQTDAALRLLGGHTVILNKLGSQIGQAILAKGKADITLQQLVNQKKTLVEIMRALKVVVSNA